MSKYEDLLSPKVEPMGKLQHAQETKECICKVASCNSRKYVTVINI